MKTIISILLGLALAFPSLSNAAGDTRETADVFHMQLVHEVSKPAGTKNVCTYGAENYYFVTINAMTDDKACHKSIKWEEWSKTGVQESCSYSFTKFGAALAWTSDKQTVCFRSAYITFQVN